MKIGDTVKLKPHVRKAIMEEREQTAVVKSVSKDGSVILDRRISDFQWWYGDDLEVAPPHDIGGKS